jgi:hypothetical protein
MSLHNNPFTRTDQAETYRCRAIDRCHLDQDAIYYLEKQIDAGTPSGTLFTVFRIPNVSSIGVTLRKTPWNDAHLRETFCTTLAELRQAHRESEMPESLIHVLHLAGEADVHILVFDDNAPKIDDLPVYDD